MGEPALITDPLVSALLIIWHMVLLAHHLFPRESEFGQILDRSRLPSMRPVEEWWDVYGPPARHLVLVSLILTVAVIGFELSRHWVALAVCSVLTLGTIAVTYRFIRLMYDNGQHAVVFFGAVRAIARGEPKVACSTGASAKTSSTAAPRSRSSPCSSSAADSSPCY